MVTLTRKKYEICLMSQPSSVVVQTQTKRAPASCSHIPLYTTRLNIKGSENSTTKNSANKKGPRRP